MTEILFVKYLLKRENFLRKYPSIVYLKILFLSIPKKSDKISRDKEQKCARALKIILLGYLLEKFLNLTILIA